MRRFAPVSIGQQDPPALGGTWEMRRAAEEVTAPRDTRTWNVFLRQSGAEFSGSILRVDGDTGTLVGHWRDGKLVMSHFAGERPNLFEATRQRRRHARRHAQRHRALPGRPQRRGARKGHSRTAGSVALHQRQGSDRRRFVSRFPDLTGKVVSDSDAQFRGKVVILAIGGSWCPNCHDEAPFLAELCRTIARAGSRSSG